LPDTLNGELFQALPEWRKGPAPGPARLGGHRGWSGVRLRARSAPVSSPRV